MSADDAERWVTQLEARRLLAENRQRTRGRKVRAHACIVAGALLLDAPHLFGLDAARVRAALDQAVTRPHDRRALGLDVEGDRER